MSLKAGVVHLIWIPYGTELFEKFIASYVKYEAGHPHELVLLFNGVNQEEDLLPYTRIAEKWKVTCQQLVHWGNCQDIDAYYWAARQLQYDHLLFLNSYAKLLTEHWLLKYIQAIDGGNVGLVGATGSWESYYTSVFIMHAPGWEKNKTLGENFGKYKLFMKTFLYWRFLFRPFPNPHIRTNAFMISRELLLSCKKGTLRNKFKAYLFESGRNSLTNQVVRKGYDVVVIDKDGNSYPTKEWANAAVFRIKEQENLLVGDNQTGEYEAADPAKKKLLTFLAWGKR